MEYSSAFVCLMGMGTVFIGLICIIVLCMLMSKILGKSKASPAVPQPAPPAAPTAGGGVLTPEAVAAVSAAIAEEMGADISAIRILSIRPL